MPVNFGAPMSMYVDRKSPEISAMLRDRYNRNFAAQNAITQALGELEVGPFQNDLTEFNSLRNNTLGSIDQMAERGDYENMGNQISKLAQQYNQSATALSRNAQAYNEDKKLQEEKLAKGLITQADYEYWKMISQRRRNPDGTYSKYAGLQRDENGRVDQNSYYTPTQIANYVDVPTEVVKVLRTLIPEKSGGQIRMTGDGIFFYINEAGMVEEISPDRVQFAVNQVLNRPDVQSYMYQQQDYQSLRALPGELDPLLGQKIASLSRSTDPELRSQAALLQQYAGSNNESLKRKVLADAMYAEERSNMLRGFTNAYAIRSEYGGGQTFKYDDLFLANYKHALSNSEKTTDMSGLGAVGVGGMSNDVSSPLASNGEVTRESINSFKESQEAAIDNSITELRTKYESRLQEVGGWSGDSNEEFIYFLNETSDEEIISTLENDPTLRNALLQAKASIRQAEIANINLARFEDWANRVSGYVPEVIASKAAANLALDYDIAPEGLQELKNQLLSETLYQGRLSKDYGISPIEITIDNPQDYEVATVKLLMNDIQEGNYNEAFSTGTLDENVKAILNSLGYSDNEATQLIEAAMAMETLPLLAANNDWYKGISESLSDVEEAAREERQNTWNNNASTTISYNVYSDLPYMNASTEEIARKATTGLKKALEGRPAVAIGNTAILAIDGKPQNNTTLLNSDLRDVLSKYEIASIQHSQANVGTMIVPTFEVALKTGKTGDPQRVVTIEASELARNVPIRLEDGRTIEYRDLMTDNSSGGKALKEIQGMLSLSPEWASQDGISHQVRLADGTVLNSVAYPKVASSVDADGNTITSIIGIDRIETTAIAPDGTVKPKKALDPQTWVNYINAKNGR